MKRESIQPPASPIPDVQSLRPTAASLLAPRTDVVAASPAHSAPDTALLRRSANRRILIVDDNAAIHADFQKILCCDPCRQAALEQAEAALFGPAEGSPRPAADFELDSAHQGKEALSKVQQALAAGRPYAMAFVDVRMPPGWDGIETVARIWQIYPDLQVVICTAYSDYSWEKMTAKLGLSNNLVILKKTFDNVEVLQLAHAFTRKWELNRRARLKLDELSQMVTQRTEQLELANANLQREAEARFEMERQLREAQKMEAVGQFAAGVAHDFNHILTIIHGHATVLGLRLGETGPHAQALGEIRVSSERAANLVRQLLTFSRKRAMCFRPVALDEVMTSVSAMLRELAGEGITVQTESSPDLPAIHADRSMIEQILVNLTLNARDAISRAGRVDIRAAGVGLEGADIEARPEARRGRFVCLAVSDTGCGIGPEAMGHLFEPFFTTKEAGKGAGLGLATVYGIVKEHQGWIEVQSKIGAGATFRCYFPVLERAAELPPQTGPKLPCRSGAETTLRAGSAPRYAT